MAVNFSLQLSISTCTTVSYFPIVVVFYNLPNRSKVYTVTKPMYLVSLVTGTLGRKETDELIKGWGEGKRKTRRGRG